MIAKFYCLLLIITFIISSVSSRTIQDTTTTVSEVIHLNIHENSYSAEDKYKLINECVQKCMENNPKQLQQGKANVFSTGRDNCIQLQCRFYQRRR
ncbi:unnamed protein product [Adineta steineri]|uniref:Uncharacterized protein n=1 Tax=Adineta steineri TaxID=433720 RepID=A0A814GRL9_9BILA|nr:unnamed protein product [Adineta steineri]CAF3869415.1 unnamed protein product [Adineta steineri]